MLMPFQQWQMSKDKQLSLHSFSRRPYPLATLQLHLLSWPYLEHGGSGNCSTSTNPTMIRYNGSRGAIHLIADAKRMRVRLSFPFPFVPSACLSPSDSPLQHQKYGTLHSPADVPHNSKFCCEHSHQNSIGVPP